MRAISWLGVVGLVVLRHAACAQPDLLIPGTPQGITETPPQMIVKNFSRHLNARRILSDAMGMSLYSYDSDAKAGKPTCVATCATAWPPMLAPKNAAVTPEWSLVARPDRSKQWAYKGKPLYRSAKDTEAGDTAGDGADGQWHLALYEIPAATVLPPAKISVRPNSIAGGDVFVDYRGFTLYMRAGSRGKCRNDDCMRGWTPLLAAQLAKRSGEWTIVESEGRRQWAYDGQPVYTFGGDVKPGDANGIFAGPGWRPAVLRYYPTPRQVKLFKVGSVLTFTTTDGMTLYTRDRYQYEPGSFYADDGSTSTIATGREIGTQPCEGPCPAEWKPFEAQAGSRSMGYWQILTRADGSKQWAYEGYALYTNTRDTKPGEMMGRDRFELLDGAHAMYWRVAVP